jgi:hypothetical protein
MASRLAVGLGEPLSRATALRIDPIVISTNIASAPSLVAIRASSGCMMPSSAILSFAVLRSHPVPGSRGQSCRPKGPNRAPVCLRRNQLPAGPQLQQPRGSQPPGAGVVPRYRQSKAQTRARHVAGSGLSDREALSAAVAPTAPLARDHPYAFRRESPATKQCEPLSATSRRGRKEWTGRFGN